MIECSFIYNRVTYKELVTVILSDMETSSRSYLDDDIHLGVRAGLGGVSPLTGRVHRVASTAAPRHRHMTVVRQPRDPLAARSVTNTPGQNIHQRVAQILNIYKSPFHRCRCSGRKVFKMSCWIY